MCYMNKMVSDDTNGIDVNDNQFVQVECSAWCPSSICQVCEKFTSFNDSDVTSCGDDNKATQMGMENTCKRSSAIQINNTWQTDGLACTCKEAGCYCYCIIQDCVCNWGVTFNGCLLNNVTVIGILIILVRMQNHNA